MPSAIARIARCFSDLALLAVNLNGCWQLSLPAAGALDAK